MKKLIFIAMFFIASMNNVNAATIYESATGPFNSTTCCGSNTNSSQFIGAVFSIDSPTKIDGIGGVFLNVSAFSGSIFGAIVGLNSSNYPSDNGLALDNVIAYNVFTPTLGSDYLAPISATLNPGTYAVVFGSGLFGTTGNQALTLLQPGQATSSFGTIIATNNSSSLGKWSTFPDMQARYRIIVTGTPAPADSEPPSLPALLSASTFSTTQINLSWAASTDNVGVTGYKIYRNGVQVGTSTGTFFIDTGLTATTAYSYTVAACDAVGNCSAQSSAVSATTSAAIQNGKVAGWGPNAYGQTTVPADLSGVVGIDGGAEHSVALKSDGTVVAWGGNDNSGRVTNQAIVPAGLSGVMAVAAGGYHTAALKNDGTVVAWGDNAYGQTTVPAGLSGVVVIAAGLGHTVVLKNDGTVVAWGDAAGATVPADLSGVVAISAGGGFTVALKNDGTVVAWGGNTVGQTTVPAGLSGVVKIASGTAHSLALKNDGTVVAWGYNFSGETTVPAGLSGVVDVAAGNGHSLALKNDGAVVGWGLNYWGQATAPAALGGVVAIAAGDSHSLALFSDSVAPTVPTGLTASAVSVTQINLFWAASTDNVGVTGYKIYRNGVQVGTSTGTFFIDTGLMAMTAYNYTVAACDAAGNCSTQSAAASATTLDNVAPTVPTGLSASAVSATQVNLSWTASTDNVGVTGYMVYRNGMLVGSTTGTSVAISGLIAATAYSFTVAACDAAGNCSAQSAAATATTASLDNVAPTVPTRLYASAVSRSQINLTWRASTDNVGVTGYKVYRNGVQVGTPSGTSYSDTGLRAGTSYKYTVAACDAALNCSAKSSSVTASTRR